jgi:hypothetical protein
MMETRKMKQVLAPEERERLEKRLLETFKDEMNVLPRDLQETLADDLVTAFQNRLAVFLRIQAKQGSLLKTSHRNT